MLPSTPGGNPFHAAACSTCKDAHKSCKLSLHSAYGVAKPSFRSTTAPLHLWLAPLLQSEVVAATLSSAGGELLQLMPRANSLGAAGGGAGSSAAPLLGFDAIICDEAAQVGPQIKAKQKNISGRLERFA